jgi:hypothetical protein
MGKTAVAIDLTQREPQHGGQWRTGLPSIASMASSTSPGAPRRIGDGEVAETVRLTVDTTPWDATIGRGGADSGRERNGR